jgi:pyruvate,orthophosphate dikinase
MAQKKKSKPAKSKSSAKSASTTKAKAKKVKNHKYVYDFGKKTDGDAKQRELLGGKGANLAEMAKIGLPVPPGFTISTEVCTYFYDNKKSYPKVLDDQIKTSVSLMEKQLGQKLGDLKKPLLLSVRSGARDSMPGMMDTILNLGLNDETVEALAEASGNARFAWDCYRRFIQMYGDVVMGVQKLPSEDHDPLKRSLKILRKKFSLKKKVKLMIPVYQPSKWRNW